ncbi:hypothetical protein COCNU_contig69406649G000010 [Cocos nucifera]|nr:hypothetical protein [Cocos nucifera]
MSLCAQISARRIQQFLGVPQCPAGIKNHHHPIASSLSHSPTARTNKAEPQTTRAAKTGGTKRSTFDRPKSCAGTHTTSPAGPSTGTLTAPARHRCANPDSGDNAHTNAISGANDVTATVAVRMAVHVAAYRSSGPRWRSISRITAGRREIFMARTGVRINVWRREQNMER